MLASCPLLFVCRRYFRQRRMTSNTPNTRYRSDGKELRFPEPYEDLQVNACKNVTCAGFGIEAMTWVKKGRPSGSDGDVRDNYQLSNRSSKQPDGMLQCQLCGSSTAIKSNKAIKEELDRIAAYLAPIKEPCCPQECCEGSKKGVYSDPDAYTCKAKLRSSKRLKCKSCGTIFSVSTTSTHRQQKPHEN